MSDSTPRPENRLRALLWPAIHNDGDFDYITAQGFWICFIVAGVTLIVGAFTGSLASACFEAAFFFLAGVGVRQRSRVAAVSAFAAYLLSGMVLQRYTGNGFNVARIIFLALLLSNIRGNWLSAKWANERQSMPSTRLNQTLGDKISDQLPMFLWPKGRFLFYLLAAAEILFLLIALFAPLPPQQ